MKKRIIGLLLVVVLLFAAVPTAYADNGDQLPFDDVKSGRWYYEPIAFVSDKGLMTGVSESSFAPNADLTRAVFVTALSRLDGNDTPADVASDFSDVPAGTWYSAHIAWAVGEGIIEGYSDGRFGPDDPVSREQMAAIIARYLDTLGIVLSEAPGAVEGFRDAAEVSDYNVRMFVEAGVPVIAGTDSSNAAYVPKISFGLDMHRELSLLVKAGMTPMEALNSASALTAEVFGFESIGAIEAGRHADLVLIGGNPGEDIDDISTIQKVWIGGVEVYSK